MTIGGVVKSVKSYFLETLKIPIYFLMIMGNFCNETHSLLMVEKRKVDFTRLSKTFKLPIFYISFKGDFLTLIRPVYMVEKKK